MQLAEENIISREELEDGSTIYEIGEEIPEENDNSNFYANLAEDLTQSNRHKLSSWLLGLLQDNAKPPKISNSPYRKYFFEKNGAKFY